MGQDPERLDGPTYYLLARCFICAVVFSSNPFLVPSYDGEPICRSCIELVNRKRHEAGRALWPVLPGAYDPEEVG